MNKIITDSRKLNFLSEVTKRIRLYCSLAMLLLMSGSVWAQISIGIQDGTTNKIPVSSCYGYSYSQQLVYASEINASGDITSISFFFNYSVDTDGATDNSVDWDVYLGHTSKTKFVGNTDWVDYASLEQVFSGTVTFPTDGNWMTLTFDTPFNYNGTDNLVVGVDENTPGWNCAIHFGKTATVAGSNRSRCYRNDATNPDPASPPATFEGINFINTMILGGIQQSCPAPGEIAATDLTETTATLGWTENGSATEWEVIYGPMGFDPEATGTTVSVTTNPTLLSGLDDGTAYDFYVKSVCSTSDKSNFIGKTTFITACGIATVPYLQDFELAIVPDLPYCTSQENNGIGNDWKTKSTATTGFTGKVLNYSYHSPSNPGTANTWFYTKGIELDAGVYYDISYTYGNNSTFYTESMKVAYGTSPTESSMTNPLADYPAIQIPSGSPVNELLTFAVATDGVYYFGFNVYSIQNQSYLYLDDISIVASPSCPQPSGLAAVVTGNDSADLSWTESTGATQWEVLYGEAGFDVENEGTSVSVNNISETSITGLTSNTQYDFYVKAICDVNDESALTGPYTFRTACDVISTLPYIEDFDTYGTGSDAFPLCWKRPVTYNSGKTYPSIVSQFYTPSPPNTLKFESAVDAATYAVSPAFAEDISNLRVTFMLAREGTDSGTIDVGVMSDADDINTFELVQTINPIDNEYYMYFVDLNQVSLSGSANFIALRHNTNSSSWYYWLDDFQVDLIPSCPEPSALIATNISVNTAEISWSGNANTYDIKYSEQYEETTIVSGEISPYTLTGLNDNTTYDVYVRSDCGEEGFSYWVGPVRFTTLPANDDPCDAIVLECGDYYEGTTASATESMGATELCATSSSGYTKDVWFAFEADGISEYTIEAWGYGSESYVDDVVIEIYLGDCNDTESLNAIKCLSIYDSDQTLDDLDEGTYYARYFTYFTSFAGEYYFSLSCHDPGWCDEVDAGIASASDDIVCAGDPFTLTAEGSTMDDENIAGLTGQWQVKEAGNWTDISGANNVSYTVINGITEETSYRFVLTCSEGDYDTSSKVTVSVNPNIAECYCTPSVSSTVEPITYVGFGDIDNTSDAASTDGYEDFAAQSTEVAAGGTYEITLQGYTSGNFINRFTVFIDWNQNGSLDDAGEVYVIEQSIQNSTGTDGISAIGDIEVPADAAEGNTRMRIVKNFNSALTDPCGSLSNGQVEDYTLIVTEGVVWDCPQIEANFGDVCQDTEGNEGVIDNDCNCYVAPVFDCSDIQANFGDVCQDAAGNEGVIDNDCNCYVAPVFDCPDIQANFGDECEDADGNLGVIDQDCNCFVAPVFDCPDIQANFGNECEDADGNLGVIDQDCNCFVAPVFDCPDILANFGDECEDADGNLGVIDQDCNCFVAPVWDCPEIEANFGDVCQDTEGNEGVIDNDCNCFVAPVFDCSDIQANFGDECDDGNASTENDVITPDCECVGTPIVVYDCPDLSANIEDTCDDGDATTQNDMITEDCVCQGTPIPPVGCVGLVYYISDYTVSTGTRIYEVTLNGNTASMEYIAQFADEICIAYNSDNNLIYGVSKLGNSYTILNPHVPAPVFSAPVNLSGGYGQITGAAFATDGSLMISSQSKKEVYSINVTTNEVSVYDSYAPIFGGDIAFDSSGMLYLATNTGGGLYKVYPEGVMDDVLLTGLSKKNTGMAITDTDQLLLTVSGSNQLAVLNTTGTSDTPYALELNGSPFTLNYGDMASGCSGYTAPDPGDCVSFSTFYSQLNPGMNESDVYSVSFSDNIADLTYITTVPFETHIGYDGASDLLYLVSKTGSFYWVYKPGTDALMADISFSENLNNITAAEFNPTDGQLYVGQAGAHRILSVNPLTGEVSPHGDAPVYGGDLAMSEDGKMYLATQSGDALLDVTDGASPEFVGGIPSKVTGSARSNTSDGLLLSNYNSPVFTEINVSDASVITSYKVMLDGEPFTLLYGDMAAGCVNGIIATAQMPGTVGFKVETTVESASDNDDASKAIAENSGSTLTSMPNPTTGLSQVVFVPAETGRTLVEVYDMNGRNVATLFNQEANQGEKYSLNFNGNNLPNGVYIYRLTTQSETIIEKFMIAR